MTTDTTYPPMPPALAAIVSGPGWMPSSQTPGRYYYDGGPDWVGITVERSFSGGWLYTLDTYPRDNVESVEIRELADLLEHIEQAIGGER